MAIAVLTCTRATFKELNWGDTGKEALVAIIAILIFAKDYFFTFFNFRSEIIGIGLLFLLAFCFLLLKRLPITLRLSRFFIFLLLLFAWTGSTLLNGSPNTSSYYASFVIALLIGIIQPRNFLRLMIVFMTINVALQIYEILSGKFIYSHVINGVELDEKFLSVDDKALRVKGLFPTVLNAISITISLALLMPRSIYPWFLLIVTSALGQGRLGLGMGVLGLIVLNLVGNSERMTISRRIRNFIFLLVSLSVILVIFLIFGSDASIQRMLEAASLENSQNQSRLYFWSRSLTEILNYDLMSHLFGRFGYIKALEGGTESDWFRIWLDNGVFCVLAYLIPLLIGILRKLNARLWPEAFAFLALTFVMAVYPHAQSMPNGILVWMMLLPFPHQPTTVTNRKEERRGRIAKGTLLRQRVDVYPCFNSCKK